MIFTSGNYVCEGTNVTFMANPINGGTLPVYQWKVNGANVGTNTQIYSYVPANNDVVTCMLTSNVACPSGNPATSNSITMSVNPSLPVGISINATSNPTCTGTTVNFNAIPTNGGTSPVYQWKINGNNVGISSSSHSYTPTNGDVVTCTLTSNVNCATGNPATSTPIVMSVFLPIPTITGSSSTCLGALGATYTTEPNMTDYTWTVSAGGTIISGSNNSTLTVAWNTIGAKTVAVSYTNSYGCTPATPTIFNVDVLPLPVPAITGLNSVCEAASGVQYTTDGGMTSYGWSISPGGTITSGGNNQTITVTWNTIGAQWVEANYTNASSCRATSPSRFNVTVNPLPIPAITGSSSVCETVTGIQYNTDAGMSAYSWTVSQGGTITAGATSQTVTVNWNTAGNRWLKVNYTNSNGCNASSATQYNVTVNPLPVPAITGLNSVCVATSGVQYATDAGMSAYAWTISPGGTITAGATSPSVTVTWNTAGTRWVKVNYTNANGCSASTPTQYNVTVNPLPSVAGNISGETMVFQGQTNVVYSVPEIPNAISYTWILPPGAVGLSTTNTIYLSFSNTAQSGNLSVVGHNGCGNGDASFIYVNVYKQVELKLFLEGLYNTSAQMMNMAQDEIGNHYGTGISDKIDVEFHSSSAPYTVKYAAYELDLKTDGICTINLPSKFQSSYYIVIKNRNHLETWSKTAVSFAATSVNYDFTISDSKAYGNNLKQLSTGVYAIMAGDVDANGLIDETDINTIQSDATSFSLGYLTSDVNGDGVVDALDLILTDNNAAHFVMLLKP